ncbi:MAG: hypothetical protein RL329_3824 [Bacteroidota bacterium]|jgi:hypothetical protein
MNIKQRLITALFSISVVALPVVLVAQVIDNDFKNNQPKENSPFSRLGFGNYAPTTLTAMQSMGGISAGFRDGDLLNFQNPASFGFLRQATYEAAFYGKNTILTGRNTTSSSWSGNLAYLALGFHTRNPINEVLDKKENPLSWGMGFQLLPYNSVGYNVSVETKLQPQDSVSITTFHLGSGGTYKAAFATGLAYKGFALGASAGYLFGKMNLDRQIQFTNLPYATPNLLSDEYAVRGVFGQLGVQYDIILDKAPEIRQKRHLVLGASVQPGFDFTTTATQFYRRRSYTVTDTLRYVADIEGKGRMPTEYNIGFMYEKAGLFRLGADYSASDWSAYKNAAKSDVLYDTYKFAAGLEYIQDAASYKSYRKRIRYRLGFSTGTDPRKLGGEQLKQYAVTAGMGFPIIMPREQTSYMHLALEYGKLYNSTLAEESVRITVGFTLNDNTWFLKRKYQ